MERHLVLTIHGVGEQKPGETVDQVVGAATTWIDGARKPAVQVERDMIELSEAKFDDKNTKARLFPVNLRKVTSPEKPGKEALFAEVYWADHSAAPKGLINTIFDLIWVVLALGYLAMDNVEQTHRPKAGKKGRDTLPARLVHLFTWIFFGFVATMNVYLLVGSTVALTDQVFSKSHHETIRNIVQFLMLIGIYGAGIAAGVYFWNRAKTYLRRVFWRGMVVTGGFLLVAMLLGPQGLSAWNGNETYDELGRFVGLQIILLGAFWAAQSLLAVLMIVTSIADTKLDDGIDGHRRLYPAICGGMLVLWMFFISGLWLTFDQVISNVPSLAKGELKSLFDNHLQEAINSVSVVFVAILVLGLVGVVLFAARKIYSQGLFARGELLSRAILNRWAQVVFWAAAIVLAVMAIRTGIATYCTWQAAADTSDQPRECFEVGAWLSGLESLQGQIALVVVGFMAIIYRFSDVVSAALGVARDIVTYAKRRECALWDDEAARRKNYPDRTAIEDRFFRTIYYALQVFDADHITVISHSQGTIVATQMLADDRVKARIGSRTICLITMGAPVTHIYQRYFPEMFTIDRSQLPQRWFNIFREDDFVGTKIEAELEASVENMNVPPGGHTGYFTDYHVWQRLCGANIGFDLFHPKTT